MSKHVLIVGAGIAGPVAAMALQRAGFTAAIYEAYPAPATDAGAWLSVAVNGLDALRIVGVHEKVRAVGFPSHNIQFMSGTGKPLGVLPLGGALADGTVTHTMKRADLHRVLYEEALGRGIEIVHDKRLVAAEKTPAGGGIARFRDGSTAMGDLLIGADGLHSATRTLIDAAAPKPRYTGIQVVGGYLDVAAIAAKHADVSGLPLGDYRMMFGRHAFFAYTRTPDDELWWFANPPSRVELSRERLAAIDTAEWKARLFRLFEHDKGPARDIIAGTQGPLIGTNQYDLPSVPTWSRLPMIIIGDAAHAIAPSAGQGASMAIEDAIVLAKCLRDASGAAEAVAAYELLRRPRVERVARQGAQASSRKASGTVARVMRDFMLPRMFARYARAGVGALDWMYEYHVDWDAPSPMPECVRAGLRDSVN